MIRIYLPLDKELHSVSKKIAKLEDRSMASWVKIALKKANKAYLKKHNLDENCI